MNPEQAAAELIAATPTACQQINTFSREVLLIRGGRMGSGMGTLIEALWGYYINELARETGKGWEMGWLPDNEYNDFACIERDAAWEPAHKTGELLRIEAKSMNADADESKAHFDQLVSSIGSSDLLLVIVWVWDAYDSIRVYPRMVDQFIGPARKIAELRDKLHLTRGGTFVDRNSCPDGCAPDTCPHHGEPLNASGKRERLSGPNSLRPSAKVSYAANFGGLLRMLHTRSNESRQVFREARRQCDTCNEFISFIHRNFPSHEENQYSRGEWIAIAQELGLSTAGRTFPEIIALVRGQPSYHTHVRNYNSSD